VTISEEKLMAFADGELEGAARAEVEMALLENPELEKRVAQHRALRRRMQMAYSAELSEPVPERLRAAAKPAAAKISTGNVVSMQDARDAKARGSQGAAPMKSWWRPVGAIAASVVIGFGLGYGKLRQSSEIFERNAKGEVVASGRLEAALSKQLAAEQTASSAVRIGVSFVAKSGDYCRTFSLAGAVSPAGLACHRGAEWRIQTLAQGADSSGGEYRTAGSGMPAAVLNAVEEQIAGEPLDRAGELGARAKDWKPSR
jgi:anti-sigma factor RsiW